MGTLTRNQDNRGRCPVIGLRHDNHLTGMMGDAGIFSSGGGKPLFGPGGGWVISKHAEMKAAISARVLPAEPVSSVKERVRNFLRSFTGGNRTRSRQTLMQAFRAHAQRLLSGDPAQTGAQESFSFDVYAISDIEAGLAACQIAKISTIVENRRRNASLWQAKLQNAGFHSLRLPPSENNIYIKMWTSFGGENAETEARILKSALWHHGVETEPLYVPLHLRPAFSRFRHVALPNTESLWRNVFSLPVRPNLNEHDWSRINNALDSSENR